MVEKPVLNNKRRVTGKREIRPVWNNAQRMNHQNKFAHPHPTSNFVPTAIITKSGQVLVNTAKQSSPRAASSISTARLVNTAAPKSKVNDALPITYSYFKEHSPVKRAFNQKLAAKTTNFNEKVNTARVNNVTTARPKAVVSATVGNGENAVKSSACWIWRPTGNDQGIFDSGCFRHMTGNKSFLTDYQELDGGFVAFAGSPKGDSTVSTAGQNFTNADDLPTDPLMLDLEDTGIFNGTYDDEDVGAEDDLNILETTMNVSPILITRIHKDRAKYQIIGDINSATQTRRITKISKEHAMKVWRLADLPKGKYAIGTKWVYRNKKDERGIVVRNKARLVAQEEVYVCQPPGFENPQFPDKVYKVEKALYGLHQAPRACYETLSTYLLENGFRRWIIDKTLFIKKDKGDILLVHVMQRDDGIFISQDKYVADILKKFDFVTIKTTSTPIETNKALIKDEEVEDVDVHLYRSIIRSLMYLTASRPDIIYLKGQPKLGLWYPKDSPFDLEAFSDSDYARASLDRKSTIGGVVDPKSDA
ncbi:retrovirus-related pol polyprotein from transposon TNT 1-94 [Tanacetum coccineum]